MKQHITEEQLNELSEKAYARLLLWFDPENTFVPGDPNYQCYRLTGHEYDSLGYCKICFNPSHEKKNTSKGRPYLSIGQMIEFLKEKASYPSWGFIWENEIDWDEDTICDALWSACKEILESE